MVVLLDEQFLVHSAVHKAVLRLLRNCVGDDIQDQLDGKGKPMGAASNVVRAQPSEHEEDRAYYYLFNSDLNLFQWQLTVVNLLCILCSRIRTYRELLMIFFHDKHWYRSEPLFAVEEEDEDEDEEDDEDNDEEDQDDTLKGIKITPSEEEPRPSSPTLTITSAPPPATKKTEYEFLLFNYLLRFVHREGHIGEFARAGLLFLMDVAMSPNEVNNRGSGDDESSVTDPVNDAALALAEYILDGDFSEVLGAGLSAVYSLLPSKLAFFPQTSTPEKDNAMKIGATSVISEDDLMALREKSQSMGVEDARSPEFKAKIDHFLTLLMFLQDALRRNETPEGVDASRLVGTAIVHSILDAVRRIFLENVLYPSILECSDADGSAVAVMSYIEIMVRTLRDGPLANLLVDFLINEDNDDPRFRQRPHGMVTLGGHGPPVKSAEEKRTKHRRRQSSAMTLLEMEAPESRKPTDYFTSMGRFTLKDLLLSNLKSKTQPAATSALQLFQTLLIYHSQLATERILIVIPDSFATSFPHPSLLKSSSGIASIFPEEDDDDEFLYPGAEDPLELELKSSQPDPSLFIQPETTYSTHERETALYLALVSRVDPSRHADGDTFSTGYDHYLHDALVTIQGQPVYWQALEEPSEEQPRNKHRLNVNDPILSIILESLTTFFSNTPDFNVGLTGILATLATHPDRSLAGWLTFAIYEDMESSTKARYGRDTMDSDGDDRSIDFSIEEKLANDTNFLPAASMDEKSRPVVYTVFHGLVAQLERYRQTVENFDKFLLERRQGLLFSENLTDALSLALDIHEEPKSVVKSTPEPPQRPKPKPKASTSSSFVSFLTPKKSKPAKPAPEPDPVTPIKKDVPRTVSASPFGSHYEHTGSVKVEPFVAPVPASGLWTPSSKSKWAIPEDDVFGSGWTDNSYNSHQEKEEEEPVEKMAPVTLSQLLDNVVILEESIKELVAIIHARRSLGIDSLRYL